MQSPFFAFIQRAPGEPPTKCQAHAKLQRTHQCVEKSVSLPLVPHPLLMRFTEHAQKAQEEEPQGLREERWKQLIGNYVLQPRVEPPTPLQRQNVSGERITVSLVKFPSGSGQVRLCPQNVVHRDKHTERVGRARQRPGVQLQASKHGRPDVASS